MVEFYHRLIRNADYDLIESLVNNDDFFDSLSGGGSNEYLDDNDNETVYALWLFFYIYFLNVAGSTKLIRWRGRRNAMHLHNERCKKKEIKSS